MPLINKLKITLIIFLSLLLVFLCQQLYLSIMAWYEQTYGIRVPDTTNWAVVSEIESYTEEEYPWTAEGYVAQPLDEDIIGDLTTLFTEAEDPYDCLKFDVAPKRVRAVKEIRKDNFGTKATTIPMWLHKEKKSLSEQQVKKTIKAVVLRMPNLKSTPELYDLLFETMVTESLLGRFVDCNHGIAQFRLATANETMDWLKQIRPDVHQALKDLYKSELSMKDNLKYNVPFSIGLMAQYYWRVAPDIYENIKTLEDRAVLWKSRYNTKLGKGTVNAYITRVERYYSA